MFAILVVEREPIKLESLPANMFMWTLTAGTVAALVGLLVWLFTRAFRNPPPGGPGESSKGVSLLLPILAVGAVVGALPFGLNYLWPVLGWQPSLPMLPDAAFWRNLLYALNVVAA